MTISVFANVENAYLLIIWQRPDRGGCLEPREVLVVFPDSREEAKSIKEIAQAMGTGDLLISGPGEYRAAIGQALGALIK
ncbi:MAG: hypothetical protein ABR985_10995 [Methanotrichaceae archaeon]|jgi:hypothetical protein